MACISRERERGRGTSEKNHEVNSRIATLSIISRTMESACTSVSMRYIVFPNSWKDTTGESCFCTCKSEKQPLYFVFCLAPSLSMDTSSSQTLQVNEFHRRRSFIRMQWCLSDFPAKLYGNIRWKCHLLEQQWFDTTTKQSRRWSTGILRKDHRSYFSPPWLLQSSTQNEGMKRVSALEGLGMELTIAVTHIFLRISFWATETISFSFLWSRSYWKQVHHRHPTHKRPPRHCHKVKSFKRRMGNLSSSKVLISIKIHPHNTCKWAAKVREAPLSIILLDVIVPCSSSFTTK